MWDPYTVEDSIKGKPILSSSSSSSSKEAEAETEAEAEKAESLAELRKWGLAHKPPAKNWWAEFGIVTC